MIELLMRYVPGRRSTIWDVMPGSVERVGNHWYRNVYYSTTPMSIRAVREEILSYQRSNMFNPVEFLLHRDDGPSEHFPFPPKVP